MVRSEGGSLRFWGPGLLSTPPAFSMSSASHSAGSSGWLAQKTGAGPTFQWAERVDAICRSRSNRAKRPRAGCILRFFSSFLFSTVICLIKGSNYCVYAYKISQVIKKSNYIYLDMLCANKCIFIAINLLFFNLH